MHARLRAGAVLAAALTVAFGSASPVLAAPTKGDTVECLEYGAVVDAPEGTIPRDDMMRPAGKDPLAVWKQSNGGAASGGSASGAASVTIPVVFHVVRKDTTLAGGNLPAAQIDEQVAVLNRAFAGTGIRFVLQDVTRTTQPEWFNLIPANGAEPRLFRGSGKEVKMKQALHTGDSQTLNLYSASLGQSLLGWAYFPSDFRADTNPLPRYLDGVVVDYRSLPGGAFVNYGEGDTGTHEVGHWLGLYHTFDNGCAEPGDHVADTPYEATPAFRCPVGRDTCDQPGLDPITNFMDYTYDSCMSEFTAGQATRMQQVWTAFRQLATPARGRR